MKFVFAPDSFKGSLSAAECTVLLKKAALEYFPDSKCISLPIADGGEGTAEALGNACGGEFLNVCVQGPLGEKTQAAYAMLPGKRAVVEMASASGLTLCKGEKNPLKASSFGTGEVLLDALSKGAKEILIGIGGSATNDGGMGMLQALGAKFYDEKGEELPGCGESLLKVRRADLSFIPKEIFALPLRVICDVTNPLLGAEGATAVYGPQKGVTPQLFPLLEAGMENYARVMAETVGRDIASFAGAGAAGGMGAALGGVLGAKIGRGVDAVLEAVGFEKEIEDCDLVISGEGRIDGQSVRFGKAVAGVAAKCGKKGVPLAVLAGGVEEGAEEEMNKLTRCAVFSVVRGPMSLHDAMENAYSLYEQTAKSLFQTLKIGFLMKK